MKVGRKILVLWTRSPLTWLSQPCYIRKFTGDNRPPYGKKEARDMDFLTLEYRYVTPCLSGCL